MKLTGTIFRPIMPLLFMLLATNAQAQKVPNMADHDLKPYYFGITFGFNYSTFRIHQSESFALHDTFKSVQPSWGPGFTLGIMGNLRLSRFVDLRFIPSLSFAEKGITTVNQEGVAEKKDIESIYMQLPWQLKFKSDRIHNFRFYGIAGLKIDYDLAANARSRRQDEYLRFSALDLGGEVGFGFEFFFPNFIFAPEIKLSQGFKNSHFPDAQIPLSNTIDKINTRMLVFSIHLEG